MNSYKSIQTFALRVESQLSRLDIAVLNAGVRNLKFEVVASTGHEEVIQVNYLSTVLLAILLLPSLKSKSPAGSPGRLTIVGAALALVAPLPQESPLLPSFDKALSFKAEERYCTSKLLGQMFLWKLIHYISSDHVVVNIADPGFVKGTEFGRQFSGAAAVGYKAFGVT